jgi:hypothetical protein
MKTLKVYIIMVTCLLSVATKQPAAHAMLTSLPDGGGFSNSITPFNKYLCNMDPTGEATACNKNISSHFGPIEPSMKYNPMGSARSSFGELATINFPETEIARFFLRMVPDYYAYEVDAGDITFQDCDLTHSTAVGHDLFQGFYIHWVMGLPTSITISQTEDLPSSNAPVPASALLLFTGLIGLIGFRRRMMNR